MMEVHDERRAGAAPAFETPVVGEGVQGPLIGILTVPQAASPPHPDAHELETTAGASSNQWSVLIVAGQPSARIGAHRMFVTLARGLARRGIPSLRFDCGGWGDSPGDARPFEESVDDIAIAAALLRERVGRDRRLLVFGLCDGASAAVLALPAMRQRGVNPDAICLVNPWVRSQRTHDEATLKQYYGSAFASTAMWRRLLTGKIRPASLLEPLRKWFSVRYKRANDDSGEATDLPARLLDNLRRFEGRRWTILSGNDLTAAELDVLLARDPLWKAIVEDPPAAVLRIAEADHTMSVDPAHWSQVIAWIAQQCAQCDPPGSSDGDRRIR